MSLVDQDYNSQEDSDYDFNENEEIIKKNKHNSINEIEEVSDAFDENPYYEEEADEVSHKDYNEHFTNFDNANIADDLINEEASEGEEDNKIHGVTAELLFNCQNLSKWEIIDSTKNFKEISTIKYTDYSLKDIHRILRRDDVENPRQKINFIKWKIPESDLIPLFLSKDLSESTQKLLLIVLVDVTEELSEICEHRELITQELTSLQTVFAESEMISHLANIIKTSRENLNLVELLKTNLNELKKDYNEQQKALEKNSNAMIVEDDDQQNKKETIKIETIEERSAEIAVIEEKNHSSIELVLALLKQILNIFSYSSISQNVENLIKIFDKLTEHNMFDHILYFSQNFTGRFGKKLSTTMIELIYYLIRPFHPQSLFNASDKYNQKQQASSHLMLLREQELLEKARRHKNYSTRPSTFGSLYQVKRPLDQTTYIVSSLNNINNDKKLNTMKEQRQKPVKILKHRAKQAFSPKIIEEIKFINDLMIKENTNTELFKTKSLATFLQFCINFKNNCLSNFITYFVKFLDESDMEDNMRTHSEKYDYYNFFNILSFFMEVFRIESYKNQDITRKKYKKNINVPFIFNNVEKLFSSSITEKAYEKAFFNSDEKNKEKSVYELFSSLRIIKMYLLLNLDAFKSKTEKSLEVSVFLQDHLLTKNYLKIFRNMFLLFKEEYYPLFLLAELTELVEVYYYSLELYSEKRSLLIKEKLLKRKKLKNKHDDEEYLEKIYKDAENENNSNKDEEESDNSEDDMFYFKERTIDVKFEFSSMIDYNVITKLFLLIVNDNKLVNHINPHFFALKYLNRIFARMFRFNNEWIFYNIEVLNIIQTILNKLPGTISSNNFSFDNIFKNSVKDKGNNAVEIINNDVGNIFEVDFNYEQDKKQEPLNQIRDWLLRISKSFFTELKKNKLLAIECLFRIPSHSTKDFILNNYEEVVADVEDDNEKQDENSIKENEYDGTFAFNDNKSRNDSEQIDITDIKSNEGSKNNQDIFRYSPDWNKEEDIMLVDTFKNYGELDSIYQILQDIFPQKSLQCIQKRVKVLKIRRNLNKAYKRIERIYKHFEKEKEVAEKKHVKKDSKRDFFDIIIDITEEFKDNTDNKSSLNSFIENLLSQIKQYNRKVLILDEEDVEEFQIFFNSIEQIKLLEINSFITLIHNLGFSKVLFKQEEQKDENNLNAIIDENSTDTIWKLDSNKANSEELTLIIDRLTKLLEALNSSAQDNLLNENRKTEKSKVINNLVHQLKKSKKNKIKKLKKKIKSIKAEGNESDNISDVFDDFIDANNVNNEEKEDKNNLVKVIKSETSENIKDDYVFQKKKKTIKKEIKMITEELDDEDDDIKFNDIKDLIKEEHNVNR